MSELTLEQALMLLDESRQHNSAMLNRLYESLGIDSRDGEIRFKWAMVEIENIKRERNNALAQNADLVAQVEYVKSHFYELIEVAQRCDSWESFPQKPIDTAIAALESTPTQHLRDRDAEAGRAGFVAGLKVMHGKSYQLSEVLERAADQYAERVKAGE